MSRTKRKTDSKSKKGPAAAAASGVAAPDSNLSSRPLNGVYILIFLATTGLFTWLMRIELVLKELPVRFQAQVDAARLDDGTPLVTHFTGFAPLDEALRFLTVAFIAGPAGLDPSVRLQQIHFLFTLFGALCVWNVEACRQRNAWRLISFTALLALLYQTLGAAVVLPLYYASHVHASRSAGYHASGRAVPAGYARALLPASAAGYLAPTIAMYLPWGSVEVTQRLIALWQPAPAFINVLLLVGLAVLSSSPHEDKTADVKHLKRVYLFAGAVAAAAHVGVVALCLFPAPLSFAMTTAAADGGSSLPSLRSVFVPDRTTWDASTAAGLHYIFQIDEWGLYTSSLLWCWISVGDVLRLMPQKGGRGGSRVVQLAKAAVAIVGLAIVIGPGAAMAAVWSWREDKLVLIEEDLAKRLSRKNR
ncbi:hypothetical protein F4775DRAFT_374121 [Biscogniauxia sp. FL1348]|nr:hypothetical protein F4775DRAFT_374121 [Biscogniauxia sp. FL1348]